MKIQLAPARQWGIVLLIVGLGLATATIQAQQLDPPGASQRLSSPTRLRDGEPLPGAGYPWQPVARAAPAGWAPTTPPVGIDLDVTYIERDPIYKAYCVNYADGLPFLCPGTEGEQRWPAPGEVVTFTAHIVNKGTDASPAFAYSWRIDGGEVASGTLPSLAPAAEITVTYQWVWAHTVDGERVVDDHTIAFVVDPDDAIDETYETNNQLVDRTNALGFRFVITPEMYEAYNTPWDPAAFSYSAEDWLQRQVAAMNWSFAHSTYPTTPAGATERVRINQIIVSPTSLPWDRASDGGWFVDADYRLVSGWYDPVADIDWALVHELSHQVGLIDLYNLNVAHSSVQVLDQDSGPANLGFGWPRPDLMGGGDIDPHTDPHLYSSHSAGGISSTKGYRRGYYGEYQFDIPEENYLLVLDNQGNPAGNVQVSLYQRTGPANWMGELDIDNTPEITGTTGPDGRVLLANRPAGGGTTTRTGHVLRDNPLGVVDVVGNKNIFLLKLIQGDHEEFTWLDITTFNLAFWAGDTLSHTLVISAHVPPPGAPVAPLAAPGLVQAEQATVCWSPSPSPGVAGYHVYRAGPPYERVSGLLADLCYTEAWAAGRVYAVTAVDSAGRESGFSNFVWAPCLLNPTAVAMSPGGLRVVLDPQNGHALLRQQPDGRYLQNFGSVHYHLEESRFLAIDAQGRLLFSHPGDWYDSRHSIRVADEDATPIFEFGERGTGPGQFKTPAGVAVVGQGAAFEGPYPVDEHTLLLLHFDGNYDGAQGEVGMPGGTSFVSGRYDQGVLADNGDTLVYSTTGNIERTQGAIEFWLQPEWAGNDAESHTFFEVGDQWFNRIRITKDGANNLRLMVWDSTTEYGVAYNVAHWLAGEWHHVAVTWHDTDIALYVDGQMRDSSPSAHVPDTLAETMNVGSTHWTSEQAEAVIDEFRISDVPRIGTSSGFPYRILVADSGNHRLQAFDEMGNFVTAFGTWGSEPGQFHLPQGVAASEDGRVIVADAVNNRLQVLGFDGFVLSFQQIITAGLDSPVGVSLYGPDRIVVADTGNNRVVVLDETGTLVAQFTAPNDGYPGSFNQPRGALATANGDIVVADTGNQRVVTIFGGLLEYDHVVHLPLLLKNHVPPPPGCVELIDDGGFEAGTAWLAGQTPRPARYTGEQVHGGSQALLLGLKPGEDDVRSYSSVQQAISLPAYAGHITLTFWIAPLSDVDEGDRQECLLLDDQGERLATLMQDNIHGTGWTMMSYDLSGYAGEAVILYFNAYNDGDGIGVTGFYLDDVSVKACQ
ncbi:MAG: hypothetical protein JXA93_18550 [Anaerolineae bacterium]|nr:hypothetical protein [Anaerolineae bacterium]